MTRKSVSNFFGVQKIILYNIYSKKQLGILTRYTVGCLLIAAWYTYEVYSWLSWVRSDLKPHSFLQLCCTTSSKMENIDSVNGTSKCGRICFQEREFLIFIYLLCVFNQLPVENVLKGCLNTVIQRLSYIFQTRRSVELDQ